MVSNKNFLWDVPNLPTTSNRSIQCTKTKTCDLEKDVKQLVVILEEELDNRIISKMPRCVSICLYLNPTVIIGAILDDDQVESMKLHVRNALLAASSGGTMDIDPGLPGEDSSARTATLSSSSAFTDMMSCFCAGSGSGSLLTNPVDREIEDYKKLTYFEKEVGNDDEDHENFNPMLFWANPSIVGRFPLHAQVAQSYFSGLLSEATSERSFSDCGQFLTDLSRNMDGNNTCAQVRVNHGERIRKAGAKEAMAFYKSKHGIKRNSAGAAESDVIANYEDADDTTTALLASGG
jgi:hypothetical protein